jgi:glycosyl transferase family 10 (putative fucosyltransferase)
MGQVWAYVTAFFILFMLVVITILICLDEFPFKNPNSEEDDNHIFNNLTESVLHHISGGEGINFHGTNGSCDIAYTSEHNIFLIPTYHNFYEKTKQFLENKKNAKDLYVIIDGEPNPIPRKNIDIVITTKRDQCVTDIYIPYYCLYAQQYKKPIGELFDATIPKRTSYSSWQQREFIVFCYSNDNVTRYEGSANRALFYKMLNKTIGSRVHNTGRQCRSIMNLITDHTSSKNRNYSANDSAFTKYKFVVAFENEQMKGYISEKFINPLLAGSIPVYLGAEDICEHFNPDSFINVANYSNFQACIDDLLAIDLDPIRAQKILSSKPLSHDKFLGYLKSKGGTFWKQMMETPLSYLLPMKRVIPERTYFITFSATKQNTMKKIMDMAENSRNFDEYAALDTRNLPYDFLTEHSVFISENDKNHGLGIWKPTLIFRFLQNLCEGDILVFAVPGFNLTSSFKNLTPFHRQYEQLIDAHISSEKKIGVSAFQCFDNHTEYNGTKMDWLRYCLELPIYPIGHSDTLFLDQQKLDTLGNSIQLSADYILCIKCDSTMKFFQDWISSCSKYHMLNNEPSKVSECETFKKHFHDQSIFSSLMKIQNQLVIK